MSALMRRLRTKLFQLKKSVSYSELQAIVLSCRVKGYCTLKKKKNVADTYSVDPEGGITGLQEKKFPQHVPIDPEVLEKLNTDPEKYFKHHAGLVRLPTVHPPDLAFDNLQAILAENECINKGFEKSCVHLREVFLRRHPPAEVMDMKQKMKAVLNKVIDEEVKKKNLDLDNMSKEMFDDFAQRADNKARRIFYATNHNWKPIKYLGQDALIYVSARFVRNYAVMLQVMQEIKRDDPDFVPQFVYNHASGSGSVVWAANQIWGNKVFEYFCIDPSKDMSRLAMKLLAKDLDDPNVSSIEGVHFRMFPSSEKNLYSLVVSGYLMMEMRQKERKELVETLWKQTENYLVLVEYGTTAGYKLIMEARQTIQETMSKDPSLEGYIIAPCSHDEVCPKHIMKKPICTFQVLFADNIFNVKTINFQKETEKYMYVIFKKGRKEKALEYPRILEKSESKRRADCLVCCPNGEMHKYVIGRKACEGKLYWSIKKAQAGDLLPVLWSKYSHDTYVKERQEARARTMKRFGISYESDDEND